METDHSYEAEHADFDLDSEDPGKFADPYADPVEQKVDYLWQQQRAQQEQQQRAAQEAEAEEEDDDDRQYAAIEEAFPFTQSELGADRLIDKTREAAVEDGADPKWAFSRDFLEEVNPAFMKEVAEQHFLPDGTPRHTDEMITGLWEQSQSKKLSWD